MGVRVSELNHNQAKEFWDSSREASIFTHPTYLEALGHKVQYIGAFKGHELSIVWPILRDNIGVSKLPNFSYYFGPFSNRSLGEAPYKAYKNNLLLCEELIRNVVESVFEIDFSLLPEFNDIRPFQWWNYNETQKPKFDVNVRYTARFDLKLVKEPDGLDGYFRPDDKRKKYRKLYKAETFVSVINELSDIEKLANMYLETIQNSGGRLVHEDRTYLKKIILLAKNKVEGLEVYVLEGFVKETGEYGGFQLLLGSKNSIYAVAQCVTQVGKKLGANIFLTHTSMVFAKQRGYAIYDFNGANSPQRADDKHAYGAASSHYFQLSYSNTS
jgi:hypothetical protein